ncbi:alpha/beta fold hydrolase [Arcicella aquatica]|uniref:Alpha/beta fold hydrolase n=1 Tax=Arcicella aquatica TaxID=217141 RepID=A0ABU5QR92_9BACT|nr:alpha/beta fold hydrolase [Arcicella aquatica]MEA5259617.1 alpha/beta fold hydrolase [Arcicella aquatica]
MKPLFKVFIILIVICFFGYLMGPKPDAPIIKTYSFNLPSSLTDLETKINTDKKAVVGIRHDCEARIIWADTAQKVKTKLAIVYIHGFSASQEEGDPVHTNLAKRYGANLYLARLAGHGIDLGDSTMKNVTADDFIQSAEEALAIGKKLGDEVIVVGTSFGGALTLYLASQHPEIKSIVLYSPCIKIFDNNAELLDNHWGRTLAKLVTGSEIRDFPPHNPIHGRYWSTHYHINGVIALQNFLTNIMTPTTFEKVKCPTFMGYYYKNEEEQDKVVSVPAMLKMYDELGVPANEKQKVVFPNAGNHVIGSYVLSKDYQHVQQKTEVFLDKVLK